MHIPNSQLPAFQGRAETHDSIMCYCTMLAVAAEDVTVYIGELRYPVSRWNRVCKFRKCHFGGLAQEETFPRLNPAHQVRLIVRAFSPLISGFAHFGVVNEWTN